MTQKEAHLTGLQLVWAHDSLHSLDWLIWRLMGLFLTYKWS